MAQLALTAVPHRETSHQHQPAAHSWHSRLLSVIRTATNTSRPQQLAVTAAPGHKRPSMPAHCALAGDRWYRAAVPMRRPESDVAREPGGHHSAAARSGSGGGTGRRRGDARTRRDTAGRRRGRLRRTGDLRRRRHRRHAQDRRRRGRGRRRRGCRGSHRDGLGEHRAADDYDGGRAVTGWVPGISGGWLRPGRCHTEAVTAAGAAGLRGCRGADDGCAQRPADHHSEGQSDRHNADENGFRGQAHVGTSLRSGKSYGFPT